ncbi:hypothetical protein J1614_010482 [Plenodomus biglobosus]|nr:hypothetical protein J1614_010482 [Plenodomus biglobosus]
MLMCLGKKEGRTETIVFGPAREAWRLVPHEDGDDDEGHVSDGDGEDVDVESGDDVGEDANVDVDDDEDDYADAGDGYPF